MFPTFPSDRNDERNHFTHCVLDDKNGCWRKAVAQLIAPNIAKDTMSNSTLEFIGMFETVDRRYALPSRKYFAKLALPHIKIRSQGDFISKARDETEYKILVKKKAW